jgi:predicted site-specific integrase-resolvase
MAGPGGSIATGLANKGLTGLESVIVLWKRHNEFIRVGWHHPTRKGRKAMNAAIYARVSTTEQKGGYSLPIQVQACREYAARLGLEVVAEFQDDISGATRLDERIGGRMLLELAANSRIEAVIIWRLDRLSRPPEHEYSRLLTAIEHFRRHGVAVHECELGEIRATGFDAVIPFIKTSYEKSRSSWVGTLTS